MSQLLRSVIRLVDSILANIIATLITTGGVSVWAAMRDVPAYAVVALAIGVAAITLLLLVQLRQLLWQSYSAFYLGILRDVGVTQLLNRPVSGQPQETKLASDLDAWQGQVVQVMQRVGARDSEIRRFVTLGSVPNVHQGVSPAHTNLMNQIAEKIARLERASTASTAQLSKGKAFASHVLSERKEASFNLVSIQCELADETSPASHR